MRQNTLEDAMPLMMCPNCNASMQEVKRADVAFDMCPTCRGIWLDRGELEKILAGAKDERAEFQRDRDQFYQEPAAAAAIPAAAPAAGLWRTRRIRRARRIWRKWPLRPARTPPSPRFRLI
jgi:Zn-finger nucleic acid-binding protein